jgi:hypothetical protein
LPLESLISLSRPYFSLFSSFVGKPQDIYSTNILFFYDIDGGTIIAGLWNPRAVAPRPWKVNLSYSTQPVVAATARSLAAAKRNGDEAMPPSQFGALRATEQNSSSRARPSDDVGGGDGDDDRDEVHLELNRPAILNEVVRLGGDLLTSVEVLRTS